MTNATWLENNPLDRQLVGRADSYFAEDFRTQDTALRRQIEGARVLFIGAAGSIGLSTLKTVVRYRPALVHVIDHNENGLAEVIRTLRSSAEGVDVGELLTLPFDYGGKPFAKWLKAQSAGYDYILNFAALKHVRSEKDPYSILAMLETNVLKLNRLSELMAGDMRLKRMFCVSTDKAANPSSMMGATKRIMEHAMFDQNRTWRDDTAITSARFANVAMSNGSLLQSWQNRIEQNQPMACPKDCRRYFVSLSEAGHLCTLAAFLGDDRNIFVPKMNPSDHLVTLQSVSEIFVKSRGFTPYYTEDEAEARGSVEALRAKGMWPVLLTPLDTAGEKPYEEFAAIGEEIMPTQFSKLDRVPYIPLNDSELFDRFLAQVHAMLDAESGPVTFEAIKETICMIEDRFAQSHVVSDKSLDQRV